MLFQYTSHKFAMYNRPLFRFFVQNKTYLPISRQFTLSKHETFRYNLAAKLQLLKKDNELLKKDNKLKLLEKDNEVKLLEKDNELKLLEKDNKLLEKDNEVNLLRKDIVSCN